MCFQQFVGGISLDSRVISDTMGIGLGTKSGYKSGGAGEIRTRDNRFRKPMLYPSELQPLPADSITPSCTLPRPSTP